MQLLSNVPTDLLLDVNGSSGSSKYLVNPSFAILVRALLLRHPSLQLMVIYFVTELSIHAVKILVHTLFLLLPGSSGLPRIFSISNAQCTTVTTPIRSSVHLYSSSWRPPHHSSSSCLLPTSNAGPQMMLHHWCPLLLKNSAMKCPCSMSRRQMECFKSR